jgi:hypothetical protein
MIERMVFISLMVFLLMLGVNGFLIVGNQLLLSNGVGINLFTSDISNNGLSASQIINDSNGVQYNPGAVTSSTSAPGSAQSVESVQYNGGLAGTLGLNWVVQAVAGAELVGFKLAGMYPSLSAIILIPVLIIMALKTFLFLYFGMAGARALLARFL